MLPLVSKDGTPDVIAIRDLAERRTAIHDGQGTQRKLSSNYEFAGIIGEVTFSIYMGVSVDVSDRVSGDNGVDFEIKGYTVDVKTSTFAGGSIELKREAGKEHAEILVLAHYEPGNICKLIGWEYDAEIQRRPLKRYVGGGPLNHFALASELRSMIALKTLLSQRSFESNKDCPRCRSRRWREVVVHNDPSRPEVFSTRIECDKCNLFIDFGKWLVNPQSLPVGAE